MIHTDTLEYDDWEDFFSDVTTSNGYYISNIIIPKEKRGKGEGTKELRSFLSRAKDERKNVFLQAYPHESENMNFLENQERLIKWYGEHGFVHVGQGWMYWKP
jgi:predicted GNAT family N-acyltransferase